MKLKMKHRVLISLSGIVMLFCVVSLCFKEFGTAGLWEMYTGEMAKLLGAGSFLYYVTILIPMAIVALLGLFCFTMLFRRLRKVSEIRIKNPNGDLTISAAVIDNLVAKCMNGFDDVNVRKTKLTDTRDGVDIYMQVEFSNGVNIPMISDAIQKSIKKYVMNCSGVDIHNVHVIVIKNSDKKAVSKFAVPQEKTEEASSTPKFGMIPKKESTPAEVKKAEVPEEKPVEKAAEEPEKKAEPEESPVKETTSDPVEVTANGQI